MKCLEIIDLRSTGYNKKLIKRELTKFISALNKDTEQQIIKMYDHGVIDTDFSVHLSNETKNTNINESALGIQLADYMKEFGLVNHSVWIEVESTLK